MLAVAGCADTQTVSVAHQPYTPYLPQAFPSEANRVEIGATGCSIVSPAGWTPYRYDEVTNGNGVLVIIVGNKQYASEISIQRLRPRDYALYHCHDWLQSSQTPGDGWQQTKFQGQPALSFFRLDKLELDQFLYCERGGKEFLLRFSTTNIGGKLDFISPIPIVERYFETFRYNETKQAMPNTALEPTPTAP